MLVEFQAKTPRSGLLEGDTMLDSVCVWSLSFFVDTMISARDCLDQTRWYRLSTSVSLYL